MKNLVLKNHFLVITELQATLESRECQMGVYLRISLVLRVQSTSRVSKKLGLGQDTDGACEQREYGMETGGLEAMGDLEGKEESRQLPKILRVVGRV